jgi:hypothetical protein
MRTTIVVLALAAGLALLRFAPLTAADSAAGGAEKPRIRVGTFDSRAVAVAYAGSDRMDRQLKQMREQYEQAKAAGNQEKIKQLEAEGCAGQDQMHQQVFSTASVDNVLAQIRDKLPAIAKEAGVDVLVSKWDIVYRDPAAQTVDVTDSIIKPFNPKPRALQTIKELAKHQPIPLEQAKKMKCNE